MSAGLPATPSQVGRCERAVLGSGASPGAAARISQALAPPRLLSLHSESALGRRTCFHSGTQDTLSGPGRLNLQTDPQPGAADLGSWPNLSVTPDASPGSVTPASLALPLLQLRTSLRSQMCPLTHHTGCPYQSARLHNKPHRQGWPCILEPDRPRSRCGQGWFPLKPLSLAVSSPCPHVAAPVCLSVS